MSLRSLVVVAPICLLTALAGCRHRAPAEPAVATAQVTFARSRVALGSPVDITYRFHVAQNAPAFDQDYKVMVHYLDADDELMWADDHDPEIPTSQWKPGQVIEYTRTSFIPVYQYVGQASVHIGLYSAKTQKRLTLTGEDNGQLEYKAASIELLPRSENIFLLFKDGWNSPETATDNSSVEWQWTKKVATLTFRNPRKPAVFLLHADDPAPYAEPQAVQVKVNGQLVDTIQVTPRQVFIHRTPLSVAQLGSGDMVELTLDVDKTFVPALIPAANNPDSRELGLRVFHAFVEPQS